MKKEFFYLETLGIIISVGIMLTGCSKSDDQPEKQMLTLKAASSYVVEQKSGYSNYFYYNTRITSGSHSYTGTIDGTASSLPATTGPLFGFDGYVNGGNPTLSGNYYYAIGLLAWNPNVGSNGTTTITNNATVKGILTGTGNGLAYGIHSLQYNGPASGTDATITNSGSCDGQVQNHEGTAAGIYHYSLYGGAKITNNSGATCSATARYYASGIACNSYYGAVTVTNNGTARATASGSQSGSTSGKAYATGIDIFTYDGGSAAPLYFENTGNITGTTTGGTTQKAYGAFVWSQGGPLTWKNSGTITSSSTSASGARCESAYCGANHGGSTITNTGTIKGTAGGQGGWGLGVENDESYNISVTNSGSITHNNGYGLAAFTGTGKITITNSGTITGGLGGIATQTWKGIVTVNISAGTVSGNNAMVLGPNNDIVNVTGLPTITGSMDGNGGTNTLNFTLSGTLQKVNGATATKGNQLSAYGLGTSGNITVSGKTYTWKNFNVKGSTTN